MWQTSDNYKSKIYEPSTRQVLKVYINGTEIEGKYIKACKPSFILFAGNTFSLGSVVAQAIELQIRKEAAPKKIDTVYIETGIKDEPVPVGYFKVDEPAETNGNICTLKLIDDMIKFETNYDGSSLIAQKGYAEAIEILQDICLKIGVELRLYFFFKYA